MLHTDYDRVMIMKHETNQLERGIRHCSGDRCDIAVHTFEGKYEHREFLQSLVVKSPTIHLDNGVPFHLTRWYLHSFDINGMN